MKKQTQFVWGLLHLFLLTSCFALLQAAAQAQDYGDMKELNHQIRRDKFDVILPQVMRENDVDMWIHVMREAITDSFGAEELGSTSGTFVFTDRGGDRIERAIIGRRWGATQRQTGDGGNLIEESGAYDIIHEPIFVREPVTGPATEYDHRFEGLREFVEEISPTIRDQVATFLEPKGPGLGIFNLDEIANTKATLILTLASPRARNSLNSISEMPALRALRGRRLI